MELSYLTHKRILVISPESYDHIPVSKHHYSNALANAGNEVYFLNPPSGQDKVTDHALIKGLHIVDYKTIRGLNRLPKFLRDYFTSALIRKIERLCGVSFDVVWTFDPFRFQNLLLFRSADKKIYHAVDVHLAPLELEMAKTSDVILAVSEKILKRYAALGKVTAKISHGLASHFLENALVKTASSGVKVGYIGNLDNWCIDQSTLLRIVEDHPAVSFYFIGPYKRDSFLGNKLSTFSNCTLLGKIPSANLPGYLFQYDLFLMCYNGDDVDVNSNHHKILEYLATGKPSVINFTDEYKDNDVVIMSRKNAELPQLFHDVVTRLEHYSTPEWEKKRIAFARSNSYRNHVGTIDKILANFRHAPASRPE